MDNRAVIIGRAARQNQKAMKWQEECAVINRQKGKEKLVSGLKRRMIILAAIMIPAYAVLGAWWLWRSGEVERAIQVSEDWAFDMTRAVGFEVRRIEVVGARTLPAKFIAETAQVQLGSPILQTSLSAAKARVTALPEVRDVRMERDLPDVIRIAVTEREPYAIWQHGGTQQWLDRDGTVLVNQQQDMTQGYVVLVGDGVPEQAEAFLSMIEQTPQLKPHVVSASFVGERRWDVLLDSGVKVKLPDADASKAWIRLAALVEEKKLLDRAIKMIDLRIEDRVFLGLDETDGTNAPALPLTLTSAGRL